MSRRQLSCYVLLFVHKMGFNIRQMTTKWWCQRCPPAISSSSSQCSNHCINPNHLNAAPKFILKVKWHGEHYNTLVDQDEGTFPFHSFIVPIIFRFQKQKVNRELNLKCFVNGEMEKHLSYKYVKSR